MEVDCSSVISSYYQRALLLTQRAHNNNKKDYSLIPFLNVEWPDVSIQRGKEVHCTSQKIIWTQIKIENAKTRDLNLAKFYLSFFQMEKCPNYPHTMTYFIRTESNQK